MITSSKTFQKVQSFEILNDNVFFDVEDSAVL